MPDFSKAAWRSRHLLHSSAVFAASRSHAGESQLERQVVEHFDDIVFMEAEPGCVDLHLMRPNPIESARAKLVEEFRRRVGKGIAAQRSDHDARDAMSAAPNRGDSNQKNISSRQKHHFVGRVGRGHVVAGDAPMISVHVRDRRRQNVSGITRGLFSAAMKDWSPSSSVSSQARPHFM